MQRLLIIFNAILYAIKIVASFYMVQNEHKQYLVSLYSATKSYACLCQNFHSVL